MGSAVSKRAHELFDADHYLDYVFLHGLSVEMTEGARPSTGTAASRNSAMPTKTVRHSLGLFRQKYRGGRYSWGYPACPNLEDNEKVVDPARMPRSCMSAASP